MIKRIGITLATLFALLTFAAAPASATPNVAHAWADAQYQGAFVTLGPTVTCTAIPGGVDSAVQGADNTNTTSFYEAPANPTDPTCTAALLIATLPAGTATADADLGAPAERAEFYEMN